jgi:cellulose biosynthesis protein BcsQ
MQVVSLMNKKGGCGKTTIATNLAQLLGLLDKKILCIDNDEQHNLTRSLGIARLPDVGLAEVYNDINMLPQSITGTFIESIDCISGSDRLTRSRISKYSLSTILKTDFIKNIGYDFVVIDNGPKTDDAVLTAIQASDRIVLVAELGYYALAGLNDMVEKLKSLSVDFRNVSIVRNKWRPMNNYEAFSIGVREMFPQNTLKTIIPWDEELTNVLLQDKTLLLSKTKAKAAVPFIELCIELFGFNVDDIFNKLIEKRAALRSENIKNLQKYQFKGKAKETKSIKGELTHA